MSEDALQLQEGPNFYSYVLNNPATDVDPTGLAVATKGCTRRQRRSVQRAAEKAEAAIRSCITCQGDSEDWVMKVRTTTYHCPNQYEQTRVMGFDLSVCAVAARPGKTREETKRTGQDVMVFDEAFNNQRPASMGGCGCLQGVILHEVAHLMGADEPGARTIASKCFSCALKP